MTPTASLSPDERIRYARHLRLPDFGEDAQLKLKQSSVLVVGAGGLGSPVLLYLAAAGVGHITVADGDNLDLSNLQRQIIHTTADVGNPKVLSAARAIHALNPGVDVTAVDTMLDRRSLAKHAGDADFIVDATDNFASKFMINDVCVALRRPFSHAGIFRSGGNLTTWTPGHACYRCIFDTPPADSGVPAGPIGFVPGIVGSLQAAEAIKYLAGIGTLLTDTLLCIDALTMQFTSLHVAPRRNCSCAKAASPDILGNGV